MRGVRASEIIVVKSESGQYISTGLTSSLGLFSLIYWPLSLFTPLRSLLWKVISEALTRGHKFILFSHHQYNQYKALLCSCSPISISAFMAFLGYFWFWMGDIEVVRWNGVDFPVPKHLRKSKIGLLEPISAKNPYVTFFLGHPVYEIPQVGPFPSVSFQMSPKIAWRIGCIVQLCLFKYVLKLPAEVDA